MRSIIVGKGEIGKSLHYVLGGDICGEINRNALQYEIIHICFPYSESFISEVKRYQKLFENRYTVIHSTVPVGTSRVCNAIHSPVVGIHPILTESLKTFTKFLGGDEADHLVDYFKRRNVKVYITDKSETTELMKILCTTKFGIDIEYTKSVKDQCYKFGVPFEMWSLWTENYNKGYTTLNHAEYVRPNLIPVKKRIGGHCVLPNAEMLDTPFTRFLKNANKTL